MLSSAISAQGCVEYQTSSISRMSAQDFQATDVVHSESHLPAPILDHRHHVPLLRYGALSGVGNSLRLLLFRKEQN